MLHALKARGRADREEGFTLIEILVAMVLMAIVMSSLAVFFIGSQKSASALRMRQNAAVLADEAMDKVHSVSVNKLTLNRDKSSSDAQWATAVAGTVAGVDVSGMSELYDTTSSPLPANGTGTNAAVTPLPTSPQTQVVNKTPFTISYFLGTCYVPLGGGNCVKTMASASDVQLDRVVTAVNWVQPGSSCYQNLCAYVIASLISPTADPTFNVNQVVVDTTPPSTPTLPLICTGLTDQSIKLPSWANSTDASGVARYDIYEGLAADTSSMVKDGTQTTNADYTDTGLVPNTTYYYVVYAFDTVGNQSGPQVPNGTVTNPQAPYMSSCSTLPDTIAPNPPAAPVASAPTMTTMQVTWGPGTDDYKVAGYQLYRTGVSTPVAILGASTLTFTDTGLTPYTNYQYTVKTVDTAGNVSAASATSVAVRTTDTLAPSTPTALTAVAKPGLPLEIDLDWNDSTDNVGVTGYTVWRATSAGGPWTAFTTPTSGYADKTGLVSNTTYYYYVTAHDAVPLTSTASTVVHLVSADTIAPTVPAGLVSPSQTGSTVTLSWAASSDAVGVTGYQILRGGTQVGTSATPSFTDTGLASQTSYGYTIKAYDAAGNVSAAGTPLTVVTADVTSPTTPGLSLTSKTATSVTLSWTAASDTGGVTGYALYEDGGTTAITTTAGLNYTDTGEAPGTTHTYTVKAYDAAGNLSSPSNVITVTTTADTTPPSAPGGVKRASSGTNSVTISWNASTDTGGGTVAGYKAYVYRASDNALLAQTNSPALSALFTGLNNSTAYKVYVYAYDTSGNLSAASTLLTCNVTNFGSVSCP